MGCGFERGRNRPGLDLVLVMQGRPSRDFKRISASLQIEGDVTRPCQLQVAASQKTLFSLLSEILRYPSSLNSKAILCLKWSVTSRQATGAGAEGGPRREQVLERGGSTPLWFTSLGPRWSLVYSVALHNFTQALDLSVPQCSFLRCIEGYHGGLSEVTHIQHVA